MRRRSLVGRPRSVRVERVQLTSMVDMLTILIVFLLQSFSDDGSFLTPGVGVSLPLAESGSHVESTLSIEVTADDIRLQGAWVCGTEEVAGSAEPSIPALAAALARVGAPGLAGTEEAGRNVLIQCDRSREFALLKKVLRTCSESGFASPGLLVERSGS